MKGYFNLCKNVSKNFMLKRKVQGVKKGDVLAVFYYSKFYTLHYFVGVCFSVRKKKRILLSNLKKGVSVNLPCTSKMIFYSSIRFVSLKNRKGEDGIRTRGHLKKMSLV